MRQREVASIPFVDPTKAKAAYASRIYRKLDKTHKDMRSIFTERWYQANLSD